MAKSNTAVVESTENEVKVTPDIVRKYQFRNGLKTQTNAFRLAKMLSDKRRKGRGASRKEVVEKLGFDPAPYVVLYGCFEAVERGRYIYTGKALDSLN